MLGRNLNSLLGSDRFIGMVADIKEVNNLRSFERSELERNNCNNEAFWQNHDKLYITGKLMNHRFQKWMFWSIISKCNLTPGILKHCKLCVRQAVLEKKLRLVR